MFIFLSILKFSIIKLKYICTSFFKLLGRFRTSSYLGRGMSPTPEISVTKKKQNILKRVYLKILRKSPNGNEENDLQTDALPDMPRKEKRHEGNLNSNINSRIGYGDTPDVDLNDQYKFSEQLYYSSKNKTENDSTSFQSSTSEQKTDADFSDIPKKSATATEPPFSMNKTSVVVNGGVGIQFGNNITNNNTVNYVWSGVNKRKQTQPERDCSFEKSVEIQEMLKNEMELEAKHIDFLSGYLGKKWKEMGKTLGFTSGELDAVEERGGTYKDKSFEMLKRWCQKKGDEATVGKLTSKMWKSKVPAAMEAVQQLSANIKRMM